FPLWILMYFIEGLYTLKTFNPSSLSVSTLRGTFLSLISSFALIYLFSFDTLTPKTILLLTALFAVPAIYFWRKGFTNFFSQDNRLIATYLIGGTETTNLVKSEVALKSHLGYKIQDSIS